MLAFISFAFFHIEMNTFVRFLSIAISSQICQYVYLWYEHYHKVFLTNPGGIPAGVTEVQLGIIILALVHSFVGPWIFSLTLFSLPWVGPVNFADLTTWSLIALNGTVNLFYIVEGLYKIPTFQRKFWALIQVSMIIPFIMCEWVILQEIPFIKVSGAFTYILFTASYSILALRLLLSNVAKLQFSSFQFPIVPFELLGLLLFCRQNFGLWLPIATWQTIFQFVFGFTVIFFFLSGILSVKSLGDALNVPIFFARPRRHKKSE
eukprot:GHVP01061753.1.p1 GENE.GHVP01061753.1~~GHVP01061753.1.p1  ORF type:complete len:263 (+),score=29.96 GHVP01061753.1:430-1218(+)